MSRFSERIGVAKPKTGIQIDSMDSALRSRLWNIFSETLLTNEGALFYDKKSSKMRSFCVDVWHSFFKAPTDTIPSGFSRAYNSVRKYYFEQAQWYDVYDLLEFTVNNFPMYENANQFIKECNDILEQELSGYRFVGKQIVQITSTDEIAEVEEALSTPLKPVNLHIENALKLMSDRKSPDYRNSIKESISAVEAICRLIAKNEKATLGEALNVIDVKVNLHGALKRAFSSLYGYTSDESGIRHSLIDQSNLKFEDAKFMLVSCSAFVNYLIVKASKSGVIL